MPAITGAMSKPPRTCPFGQILPFPPPLFKASPPRPQERLNYDMGSDSSEEERVLVPFDVVGLALRDFMGSAVSVRARPTTPYSLIGFGDASSSALLQLVDPIYDPIMFDGGGRRRNRGEHYLCRVGNQRMPDRRARLRLYFSGPNVVHLRAVA